MGILHGVEKGNPVAHQLQEVLIAGDDDHLDAVFFRFFCDGPNHVVGLKPFFFQRRYPEAFNDLFYIGDLCGEVGRHGGSLGLIVRVELGAEGGSFGIEDYGHAIGFVIPQDLEKHGGKAE